MESTSEKSMAKRDQVLPDSMKNGIAAKPEFMEIFERARPGGKMTVHVPDVAQCFRHARSVVLVEIFKLVGYVFRLVAAALFITNEPDGGAP